MEIRKVSEKIVLDEGRKSRIISEGRKIALQRRKRMKMHCGVASVLLIMGIVVSQLVDYPKQGNVYPITVYAQEISEACEIDMIEESEFSLEKQETPLGLGYVLCATIEDGYHCKTVIGENKEGIDTIFQDEDYIYWVPDYWKYENIKIYDENGNLLDNAGAAKDSTAQITYCVYDKQEMMRFQMTIQLHEEDGVADGVILELISYPELMKE